MRVHKGKQIANFAFENIKGEDNFIPAAPTLNDQDAGAACLGFRVPF